jgi:hypothetical protein
VAAAVDVTDTEIDEPPRPSPTGTKPGLLPASSAVPPNNSITDTEVDTEVDTARTLARTKIIGIKRQRAVIESEDDSSEEEDVEKEYKRTKMFGDTDRKVVFAFP